MLRSNSLVLLRTRSAATPRERCSSCRAPQTTRLSSVLHSLASPRPVAQRRSLLKCACLEKIHLPKEIRVGRTWTQRCHGHSAVIVLQLDCERFAPECFTMTGGSKTTPRETRRPMSRSKPPTDLEYGNDVKVMAQEKPLGEVSSQNWRWRVSEWNAKKCSNRTRQKPVREESR